MTDGELVREALGRRPAAYEELLRRWTPRVLAVCHSRVRRADVAEDLAQEALVRAYTALATLSDSERFGAWICGIATRVCLDWLKAKARTQVTFSDMAPHGGAEELFASRQEGEAARVERQEEVKRLLAEVEALPEEYRKVIMLYYYEDVTYQDIAELLGVSAATINARLTKARALLRRRLIPSRRPT